MSVAPDVPAASPFKDPRDAARRLAGVRYLADDATATVVFLAERLAKPVLVEGPAGVGKTELAKAIAAIRGADLIRLQCYEGLDEAKALYEWNYKKQLLRIQADGVLAAATSGSADAAVRTWDETRDDIFGPDYLLSRPLLQAISSEAETVLLIDEVDKVDFEFEALLLEVLSDFQVTVPELGTIAALRRPWVVLTSNNTRELSEALKRRCLYLALDYPSLERERDIVLARIPEAPAELAAELARVVASLRGLELRKPPSISETLDWVHALLALGADTVDEELVRATLPVVLKHRSDVERATEHLRLATPAER